MNPESTTVEFEIVSPDALITATRPIEITPLAGQPASNGQLTETLRLARYGSIVTVTLMGTGPLDGDVRPFIGADTEAAEVHFIRVREMLRVDGWTLAVVPVAATEKAPF